MIVPELNVFTVQKDRLWDYICNYFNLSLAIETSHAFRPVFGWIWSNGFISKFIHIEVYRVVGGKVKYKLIEQYEESNNHAQIVPLAQRDVILTFVKESPIHLSTTFRKRSNQLVIR